MMFKYTEPKNTHAYFDSCDPKWCAKVILDYTHSVYPDLQGTIRAFTLVWGDTEDECKLKAEKLVTKFAALGLSPLFVKD